MKLNVFYSSEENPVNYHVFVFPRPSVILSSAEALALIVCSEKEASAKESGFIVGVRRYSSYT